MRLRCSSLYACPVERLTEALTHPVLLQHVAAPMLTFTPLDPPARDDVWALQPYTFVLRIAGRLSIGEHTIVPRPVDDPPRVWHDAGHSPLIRVWDHQIELTDVHGMTRYTDVVEIHAGALTVPAWLFANAFYRHRQRRLARLVAADFDYAVAR